MESGKWALIKNGFVVNTILADEEFIKLISNEYDYIVDIDNANPYPSIGWLFNPTDGSFETPPVISGAVILEGEVVNETPALEG